MPAPAQLSSPLIAAAGYTGMDDVLIPTPAVPAKIISELYPLRALGRGINNEREGSDVYITSESFGTPTSTSALAGLWVTRHSDTQSKLELINRGAVTSIAAPSVFDDKGAVYSPVYTLTMESQGAHDRSGKIMQYHDYDERYRQMFHFLPVSATQIFTARVVREVQYFQGFPQFEPQYQHFLATLKRDTATLHSTLEGSKPLTRRFYTAFFSFEIFVPEKKGGGNQWLINKDSSQRTDVWHTKAGDVDVNMGVVSGYDFDPARENKRLKENAKGLVGNLPGLVNSMAGGKFKSKLTYIEVPFGSQLIYGHTDDDGYDTEVDLTTAYKTGKKFHLYIRAKSSIVAPMLPELYKWLAQFRIIE